MAKAAPAVDPAKPDDAPEQLVTEAPGSGTKRRLIVFGAPVGWPSRRRLMVQRGRAEPARDQT